MKDLILHFNEIGSNYISLVGGKGANLGEMTKMGFPVPQGFCITTEAYKLFISQNNVIKTLISELQKTDINNIEKIQNISKNIRKVIREGSIQDDIQKGILDAWIKIGKDTFYAIRSSATAEDLPSASFAGQQDTYLNISSKKDILENVKKCWASLFTDRAVLYRNKNGFNHKSVFLSVVVQEMVFSEVSGIMFTADPVTGKRKTISINSSFGLGEALVGGLVLSDTFTVNNRKIIKKEISKKKIQIISDKKGGTIQKNITSKKQGAQSLSDEQILELASIGSKIEKYYGCEQDIEWCLFKDKFYIVQTRPITTIYPLPLIITEGLHFYFSIGHIQMMTEAMKPLGLSLFNSFSNYLEKYFNSKTSLIINAGSRLYLDAIHLLQYRIFGKILPKFLGVADESISNILVSFIETKEFKKIKPRGISFRRKRKVLFFLLGEIKLFLFGRFKDTFSLVNNNIEGIIINTKKDLQKTSSTKKIKKIKTIVNNIPNSLYNSTLIYYMPLAIGTYKLLGILSKKWLGDTNEIDAIGKAPEGNITTQMGLELGDIADIVREKPEIKKYLKKAKDKIFWEGFNSIKGGEYFSKILKRFFNKYGMRCTNEIDITHLRWKEQPTQVVSLILNNVENFTKGQHRRDFLIAKEEAQEAINKFLGRIRKTSFGLIKKMILKKIIFVFRKNIGIREHPKFLIINILGLIKDSLMNEANILVEKKILKKSSDIYYFSLDEIEEIIESKKVDFNLLQEKKLKFSQDKKLKPPRVFLRDGEIPLSKSNKLIPSGAITGTGASSGIIEGRARVIFRLEDADLQKGDILITPYTDPAWTTLFGIAGAVITEVGGILTHGAVVAREYGIPAVVGVDNATSLIKDGSMIRVNGNEGYIEII